MRLVHRIASGSIDTERRAILRRLGVEAMYVSGAFCAFDIDESHPSWREVENLAVTWGSSDFVRTEFNRGELIEARYLAMGANWHHGYPQPENDFRYLEKTYGPECGCMTCEVGKRQHAPFRMKREPKWGGRHILQLNWVFDEFFVFPQVWQDVFKPFGIACLPVLDSKSGRHLKTVVQLVISEVADSPLALDEKYPSETCRSCGQRKYVPITHGFFPAFLNGQSPPVVRSQEYFGNGGSAWRAIIVSAAMYQAMSEHMISGTTFTPMAAAVGAT